MRWVTYGPERQVGLVVGDEIRALDDPRSLLELIRAGGDELTMASSRARDRPTAVVPFADARLHAPFEPPSIRDFLSFPEHLRNCMGGPDVALAAEWSQIPGFYFSNVAAVLGPYDDVMVPPGCRRFDFELEVAAVVGTPATNVAPHVAERHVLGLMIFCDWSARDLQMKEWPLGLGPAKAKDSANTLGPMLVTVDELEDRRSGPAFALEMTAYVNGIRLGGGSLDAMTWSFGEMISYASRGTTVRPGDVFGSGTVPTGCLLEAAATRPRDQFPGWLQLGDVVSLSVDELGSTEQRIVAGDPLHPLRTGF
jgi:2-keto-4-pentenoate hydratase/2-oxohepta-3-ene-1,7-dioic acid hydratase in catechol pathway